MKLEINSQRNHKNYTGTWKINSILLNNQWVTEGSREEIKNFLKSMTMGK